MDVAGRTAVEVVLASLMHAMEVLGEMVEAVLGATGVVVVLRMVAVAAVLGMLIGEGSRIGELR